MHADGSNLNQIIPSSAAAWFVDTEWPAGTSRSCARAVVVDHDASWQSDVDAACFIDTESPAGAPASRAERESVVRGGIHKGAIAHGMLAPAPGLASPAAVADSTDNSDIEQPRRSEASGYRSIAA